ncbi:MAG: DUF3419 family protein [Verrucomicrobia bacterium]|nr:DUF3419 family protein [Cytophagales bacterium]
MHSEFSQVNLDLIRYSLVWEDGFTVLNSLRLKPEDKVLVISSAGTNVLNTLLQPVNQVVAIDINPLQNQLLLFQMHVIKNHVYEDFKNILGLGGEVGVKNAFSEIKSTLPTHLVSFWEQFFCLHPRGILTSGKLEKYLNGFFPTLSLALQKSVEKLFTFDDLAEQKHFFNQEIAVETFKKDFIFYFNELNLSAGRDPLLFKYAQESSGETFYKRFAEHTELVMFKNNFYLNFLFFGCKNLSDRLLPACYQEENYLQLKANIDKIEIIEGEAINYLLSEAGKKINKASLSNIFEYTTSEEFDKVCQQLIIRNKPLHFVYWNLLQEQIANNSQLKTSTVALKEQSCFYFKNAKLVEIEPSQMQ